MKRLFCITLLILSTMGLTITFAQSSLQFLSELDGQEFRLPKEVLYLGIVAGSDKALVKRGDRAFFATEIRESPIELYSSFSKDVGDLSLKIGFSDKWDLNINGYVTIDIVKSAFGTKLILRFSSSENIKKIPDELIGKQLTQAFVFVITVQGKDYILDKPIRLKMQPGIYLLPNFELEGKNTRTTMECFVSDPKIIEPLKYMDRFGNKIEGIILDSRESISPTSSVGKKEIRNAKVKIAAFETVFSLLELEVKEKPKIQETTTAQKIEEKQISETGSFTSELNSSGQSVEPTNQATMVSVVEGKEKANIARKIEFIDERIPEKVIMPIKYKEKPFVRNYVFRLYDDQDSIINQATAVTLSPKNGTGHLNSAHIKCDEEQKVFILTISNEEITEKSTTEYELRNLTGETLLNFKVQFVQIPAKIDVTQIERIGQFYSLKYRVGDSMNNKVLDEHTVYLNDVPLTTVATHNDEFVLTFKATGNIDNLKLTLALHYPEEIVKYADGASRFELALNTQNVVSRKVEMIEPVEELLSPQTGQIVNTPVVSSCNKYIAYYLIDSSGTGTLNIMSLNRENVRIEGGLKSRRSFQNEEQSAEFVYTYFWHPRLPILIYTAYVGNVLKVYGFNAEKSSKFKLIEEANNITGLSLDEKGHTLVWSTNNILHIGEVSEDEGVIRVEKKKIFEFGTKEKAVLEVNISPNGRYIAFLYDKDVYLIQLDEKYDVEEIVKITNDEYSEYNLSWSPNGRYLAFYKAVDNGKRHELYVYDLLGSENKKLTLAYKDLAYNFGKPVWFDNDSLIIAANDVLEPQKALKIITLPSLTLETIEVNQNAVAFANLGFFFDKTYELRAIYTAFTRNENIYIGRLITK